MSGRTNYCLHDCMIVVSRDGAIAVLGDPAGSVCVWLQHRAPATPAVLARLTPLTTGADVVTVWAGRSQGQRFRQAVIEVGGKRRALGASRLAYRRRRPATAEAHAPARPLAVNR